MIVVGEKHMMLKVQSKHVRNRLIVRLENEINSPLSLGLISAKGIYFPLRIILWGSDCILIKKSWVIHISEALNSMKMLGRDSSSKWGCTVSDVMVKKNETRLAGPGIQLNKPKIKFKGGQK
jgi:hypothetical protein